RHARHQWQVLTSSRFSIVMFEFAVGRLKWHHSRNTKTHTRTTGPTWKSDRVDFRMPAAEPTCYFTASRLTSRSRVRPGCHVCLWVCVTIANPIYISTPTWETANRSRG